MPSYQSLLARLPVGMTKAANIESPDEMQLEQDFSRLAYTFLNDRASGLIQYLIGFEIVDREEDGSKAVGIFGFKVGNTFFYVPSFFVNGQVRGMDLLYNKKTNSFVPLREGWVNYIVNRQTIELGEGVDGSDIREDFSSPDFGSLVEPPVGPGGVKQGAVEVAEDGFATWNQLQAALVESMDKDAEFQAALGGALARLEKQASAIEKTAEGSQLVDYLSKAGGVKAVNSLMATITGSHGFAKAALAFYPDVESLFVTEFDASLAPKTAAKLKVETVVHDYMDGKDKTRIVRDGFTITDPREQKDKSEVYDVDYEKRFHNPDHAGKYTVLLRSGSATDAWVFEPKTFEGEDKGSQIAVKPEERCCFEAEPGAIYVRGDEMEEADTAEPYEAAVELSSIKPDEQYLFINAEGDAVGPFRITAIVAESEKRLRLKVRRPYNRKFTAPFSARSRTWETTRGIGSSPCHAGDVEYLELSDHPGKARRCHDAVIMPSDWKALELTGEGEDNAAKDAFVPGTMNDMLEALAKTAVHKLTVSCDDGLEYGILFNDRMDGRPCNYKTAAVKLVSRYGMDLADAEDILKEANDHYKARRMVKLAQVGVQMPMAPEQSYGTDEFTGIPTVAPETDIVEGETIGAPVPQDPVQPGFNLGGEAEIDMQSQGLAQEAARTGQKQVFDHASIGGLARLYDVGAVLDSYIPELMKALDRLGRVLFLFYWKNEEFAERYGDQDMSELEDNLRGVFKSFGDLVLSLREKAIEPDDADLSVFE